MVGFFYKEEGNTMAKVEKPRYGVKYWKPGKATSTIWLTSAEAQDRKVRALKNQGYNTLKVSR